MFYRAWPVVGSMKKLSGGVKRRRGCGRLGKVRGSAACGVEPLESRLLLTASYIVTDLGALGGTSSAAMAINASGRVVGWADTGSGTPEAFIYSNGKMTGLGTLSGGTSSGASAINFSGEVVGTGTTASGAYEAFIYNGGAMTGLSTLEYAKRQRLYRGLRLHDGWRNVLVSALRVRRQPDDRVTVGDARRGGLSQRRCLLHQQ